VKIGDLFLDIGIQGAEKTMGSLTGVQKGLKETASMSLEAKAALVGVFYALERVFAQSGQRGTDLTNFNTLLGGGTQTIQRYMYAAQQVGVANKSVESSFKSLSATMTKTLMGEGAPKGLAQVARLTGGFSREDVDRFARQPELLLQRLSEYAKREKSIPLRNEVLKSFGLGDDMIAAVSKDAFNPQALAKAPTYNENEVASLNKSNIAWSNLGTTMEMAFGRFNAAHGGQLVQDLTKITGKVITLAEAFTKLAETGHLFEWIGKMVDGWSTLIGGLTTAVNDLKKITDAPPDKKGDVAKQTAAEYASAYPALIASIVSAAAGIGELFTGGDYKSTTTPQQQKQFEAALKGLGANNNGKPEAGLMEFLKTPLKISVEDGKISVHPIIAAPGAAPAPAVKGAPAAAPRTYQAPRAAPVTPPGAPPAGFKGASAAPSAAPPAGFKGASAAPSAAPPLRLVMPQSPLMPTPKSIVPPMPAVASAGGGNTQNVNVSQSLNFQHDGTDPKKTADSVKVAVQQTYRQMFAQGQVT
jgi:hypothetical protein